MKYTYNFVNEEVAVEVSEEWAAILADMDRKEHNNNRKSYRRKERLDERDDKSDWFADETLDPAVILENKEFREEVAGKLMSLLTEEQRNLIETVIIGGMPKSLYAEMKGISRSAVSHQMSVIRKKLKEVF